MERTRDEIFREVYRKYRKNVFRMIIKHVYNRDAAEDLVQEVFLRLYERGPSDLSSDGILSYLLTMARHIICDYFRKETSIRQTLHKRVLEEASAEEILSPEMEDYSVEGEIVDFISEMIDSFPEQEQNVYREFIAGRTVSDISEKYRISRYRISRIEEKITGFIKGRLKHRKLLSRNE